VRVGIDIRSIGGFGVGTYVRNVLRHLGRVDSTNEYLLIGLPEGMRALDELPPNFRVVPCNHGDNSFAAQWEFRRLVRRLGCDLVHIPHMSAGPQFLPCPFVITVHDLLDYMYRARNHQNGHSNMHFYLSRRMLRKAARVLAVSNFTKKDIERLFDIDPQKIEVVYNAIDERFRQGHTNEADRQLIAERYQVNYPFLLYTGRISPHKNVVRLIEAFSALKAELAKEGKLTDLKLIIIGDEVSTQPNIRRTVIKSGVQNDVRFLGFVPIEVLRIFYDAAKVFVFPSLYEGFGLPPLEAMAHGTPVVTSNTSSLPEVVGNAAVLVNPENIFEMVRALHRVLTDQPLRERLKQRGYEQAQRYSWENSVRRLRQVYAETSRLRPNAAIA
jgi:glycosyltransferase involved in cell wall biosynthesis